MGYYTFKTFILKKYNIQPVAVIDQKFNQKGYKHQFDGVQTYGTEDPILKDTEKKDAIVVVTIGNKKLFPSICKLLKEKKIPQIFIAFDIFEYHLSYQETELTETFWHNSRQKILDSYEFMTDSESKAVFTEFIRFFSERKMNRIKSHPINEQYFPKDIELNYSKTIN